MMRLLTLILLITMVRVSVAQETVVSLNVEVINDEVRWEMEEAIVKVYQGDELVFLDTANFLGRVHGIILPINQNYRITMSKEGFVTKMATLDAHYETKKEKKEKEVITFNLQASLFEACEVSDYGFLENEPLIEFYIDSLGEYAWDREYVEKMSAKVETAKYGKLNKSERALFLEDFQKATKLMEEMLFEEALPLLEKAVKIVPCGKVTRKIEECKTQIEKQKNYDKHIYTADNLFEEKKYTEAYKHYREARNLQPGLPYPKFQMDRINELTKE
ncbi:MAG: hypothetical protein WDZ35_03975 [Crocinitomicaceae bacterium]